MAHKQESGSFACSEAQIIPTLSGCSGDLLLDRAIFVRPVRIMQKAVIKGDVSAKARTSSYNDRMEDVPKICCRAISCTHVTCMLKESD